LILVVASLILTWRK